MSLLYTTSNSRPNVGYNLTNELLCLVFALQQIRKRNYEKEMLAK